MKRELYPEFLWAGIGIVAVVVVLGLFAFFQSVSAPSTISLVVEAKPGPPDPPNVYFNLSEGVLVSLPDNVERIFRMAFSEGRAGATVTDDEYSRATEILDRVSKEQVGVFTKYFVYDEGFYAYGFHMQG